MKKLLAYIASVVVATGVLSLGVLGFVGSPVAQAATQTVNVYPNSDVSLGNWTSRSGGSDNWGRVHRPTGDANDNSYFCSASGATTGIHNAGAAVNPNGSPLPMPDVQQGVTSIQAAMRGKAQGVFLNTSHPTVGVTVRINGTDIGSDSGSWSGSAINLPFTNSCSNGLWWGGWMNEGFTVTPSAGNEWTQSDINTMQFTVFRSGNNRPVRIMSMNAQLTYVTYSTLTQNGYRFYQNANNLTPGVALGTSPSTPVVINRDITPSLQFRLRAAVQTTGERWLRQYGTYKLQYTTKNAGTCAVSTGWGDVGTTGDIRWNTNPGVANGTAITAAAPGEPGGTKVYQRYQSANPFNKQQQVPDGQFGMWDFSLQYVGSNYASYCFRVVNSDGNTQPLSGYSNYPEISFEGQLGLDIVSAGGVSVASPKVGFSQLIALPSCQQSNGLLGTTAERIRVTDNRASGNWSLSIAATSGATARWTSGANSYAFNNPAGSPAGCGDGQLSLNFAGLNSTPRTGCAGVGLYGNSGIHAFTGNAPITIGGAAGADRFCYWDVMGIGLQQQVPALTAPGIYTLDMTITVMAQ